MDIKTLLGTLYKDGMTLDEINTALADKNYVDPETLPKSVTKDVFDKTASELAKAKKELADVKNSSLTSEQKLQQALDDALVSKNQYVKELAKLGAKEIFVGAGLTEKDYTPLLEIVTSEDEESTKARAKSMVDLLTSQKSAVEKAVRADLLKSTPTPPAGQGTELTYDKQIEAAQQNGDMATVAALIRQQAAMKK